MVNSNPVEGFDGNHRPGGGEVEIYAKTDTP